jgi:polysaccharide deacetylase family protein (PEP-CTERM system associated)
MASDPKTNLVSSHVASARPRASGPARDILTISVEDYFQVAGFQKLIRPGHWYRFERRIEQNTRRALDLLDEFGVHATFFTLGWVAEQVPEVIKGIVARGHEVATKGYFHRSINDMTPAEFREDVQHSREAIERATGVKVVGHRAARGTLLRDQYWALQILAEEGFTYDATLYPWLRAVAAEPWRRFPHVHRFGEREIWEIPYATWAVAGNLLPIAGGNSLRQLPHWLMRRLVHGWHTHYDQPFVMYFHVWELDAALPMISAASMWTRMRQYRNLDRMPALLRHYLSKYTFGSIAEYLGLESEPAPSRESVGEAAVKVGEQAPRERLPVTIVVPCYNEEKVLPYLENTLRHVAARLGQSYDTEFLFVDDCSTDDTWSTMKRVFASFPNCRFVQHEKNQGVAAAIMNGIRHARTEVVCSIDCDCTYDPHQLVDLIPALEADVALVTGSPYHPSGRVLNVPRWRLALSWGLSALYRRVCRQKLWTYTSCFRVYRRSAMLDLPLSEGGFLGMAEMLGLLDRQGRRITERPAVLEVRMLGRSKMKLVHTIRGHLGLLARLALARWRGEGSPTAATRGGVLGERHAKTALRRT